MQSGITSTQPHHDQLWYHNRTFLRSMTNCHIYSIVQWTFTYDWLYNDPCTDYKRLHTCSTFKSASTSSLSIYPNVAHERWLWTCLIVQGQHKGMYLSGSKSRFGPIRVRASIPHAHDLVTVVRDRIKLCLCLCHVFCLRVTAYA